MMQSLKTHYKQIRDYDKIAHFSEIGRRYFAMNSFDGLLTILGIIFGGFLGGIRDSRIILTTGFGACIAMGVSGFWGTYMIESAEREKTMLNLQKHTLNNLHNTKIGRASRFAIILVSFIDGFSPFLAALFVLLPFFFASLFDIVYIFYISFIVAFLLLIALGAYLGSISKESMVKGSINMVAAGIICVVLSLLFVR